LYGCRQCCSNIRALATDYLFGLFSCPLVGVLPGGEGGWIWGNAALGYQVINSWSCSSVPPTCCHGVVFNKAKEQIYIITCWIFYAFWYERDANRLFQLTAEYADLIISSNMYLCMRIPEYTPCMRVLSSERATKTLIV
jgi:hypothetical protein